MNKDNMRKALIESIEIARGNHFKARSPRDKQIYRAEIDSIEKKLRKLAK